MSDVLWRRRAVEPVYGDRWNVRDVGVALLCALCLCACGGAAGTMTNGLQPIRTFGPPGIAAVENSLDARMEELAQGMERVGVTRGELRVRGFIPAGSRETVRVEVPADGCATIVALASAGVNDMDSTLYLPDGTLVTQDNEQDAHPTVQVCAEGEARHFYLVLHAYDGAGAYLVSDFLGDRSAFARAAAVIGGRPGVAGEAAELSAAEQAVQTLGDGLRRRSFSLAREPVSVTLASAQNVRIAVPVEAARCYTVATFALDGLQDVNLRVFDEEDREVAFDTSEAGDAAVQFCVDAPAQFNAEVIAAVGRGATVVATFVAPQVELGGAVALWLGRRSDEQLSTRPLNDGLRDDAVASVQAGYAEPAVRARGRLAAGEAAEHTLHLKAGTCTRVAVVGGEGTGALRVDLVGAQRRLSPRQLGDALSEVCATEDYSVRAIVVSRRGVGDYAVTAAARPASAAGAL